MVRIIENLPVPLSLIIVFTKITKQLVLFRTLFLRTQSTIKDGFKYVLTKKYVSALIIAEKARKKKVLKSNTISKLLSIHQTFDPPANSHSRFIQTMWILSRLSAHQKSSGATAERVQKVHLHPSKFDNRCSAPLLMYNC